ncbi:MAG: DUF4139 domain-containing protein [Polyangiaceae bacterium]|nr:DUF4139 domain-containing protein [Polyangiaceae bacterium]
MSVTTAGPAGGALECTSRIESAAVYARGAVVARRVTPPPGPLPAGPVDLLVPGITLLALAGTFRVYPEGERRALRVSPRLHLPPPPAERPALSAEIAAARRRLAIAQRARQALDDRRVSLASFVPRAVGRGGLSRRDDPAARIEDALAAGALVDEVVAEFDRRVGDLDAHIEDERRALERAESEATQAAGAAWQGGTDPTWSVLVRFEGSGALPSFRLEYAVEGARWWPVYAAHVSFAERALVWHLDALVAQDTGEDWRGVRLAFSTADLVQDARLPTLAPLRVGRNPGATSRGYRAPPAGADRLFVGYDAALNDASAAATTLRPSAPAPNPPPPNAPPAPPTPVPPVAPAAAIPPAAPPGAPALASPPLPRGTMLPAPAPRTTGSTRPRAPSDAPRDAFDVPPLGRPGVRVREDEDPLAPPSSESYDELPTQPGTVPASIPPLDVVEPGPSWLDFDALTLSGADDPQRRGKLTRRDESTREQRAQEAATALGRLSPPPFCTDPLGGRGHFDARYEAEAAVDVDADARPHRVHVLHRPAPVTFRFRCVPREDATVYREAEATNPFGAALLGGPVDVFLEGTLSTTVPLAPTERGGTLQLGLGAEDRVRVARGARSEERSAAVLGGPTATDHTVTIDIRSSLSFPVRLELIERVPVADDRAIEARLVYARPKSEPYDQADRGSPVRGGLRWWVDLGPAERARVEYSYFVAVPPKTHLVGGNRREP